MEVVVVTGDPNIVIEDRRLHIINVGVTIALVQDHILLVSKKNKELVKCVDTSQKNHTMKQFVSMSN